MLAQVTTLLTQAALLAAGIIDGIGEAATFMFSNPLTFLSVAFSLVGLALMLVRRKVRH